MSGLWSCSCLLSYVQRSLIIAIITYLTSALSSISWALKCCLLAKATITPHTLSSVNIHAKHMQSMLLAQIVQA